MGKIRINELARELEVKPNRLLEMLPQFGITEKRTHSSSVDDDVANRLRRHFGFLPQEPEGAEEVGGVGEAAPAAPPEAVESGLEAAGSGRTAMAPGAPTTPASAMAPEAPGSTVSAETAALKEGLLAGRTAPQRLRPPLAGARPAVEAAPPSAAAGARPSQRYSCPAGADSSQAGPNPYRTSAASAFDCGADPQARAPPSAARPPRAKSSTATASGRGSACQAASKGELGRPTGSSSGGSAPARSGGSPGAAQGHARAASAETRTTRLDTGPRPAYLSGPDPPRSDHPHRGTRRHG